MAEKEMILDDADRLLSIAEASARMRTSPVIIKRLINAKLMPVIWFKRNSRIPKSALNKFIEMHTGEDIYETLREAES